MSGLCRSSHLPICRRLAHQTAVSRVSQHCAGPGLLPGTEALLRPQLRGARIRFLACVGLRGSSAALPWSLGRRWGREWGEHRLRTSQEGEAVRDAGSGGGYTAGQLDGLCCSHTRHFVG